MNKLLPILLVVVLSGCATQYYDRRTEWSQAKECNLTVPECIYAHHVCMEDPTKCRFRPYKYVFKCDDIPSECRHQREVIELEVKKLLIENNKNKVVEKNEVVYSPPKATLWESIRMMMPTFNTYSPPEKNRTYRNEPKQKKQFVLPPELQREASVARMYRALAEFGIYPDDSGRQDEFDTMPDSDPDASGGGDVF